LGQEQVSFLAITEKGFVLDVSQEFKGRRIFMMTFRWNLMNSDKYMVGANEKTKEEI
jgi:hypothetical protein